MYPMTLLHLCWSCGRIHINDTITICDNTIVIKENKCVKFYSIFLNTTVSYSSDWVVWKWRCGSGNEKSFVLRRNVKWLFVWWGNYNSVNYIESWNHIVILILISYCITLKMSYLYTPNQNRGEECYFMHNWQFIQVTHNKLLRHYPPFYLMLKDNCLWQLINGLHAPIC